MLDCPSEELLQGLAEGSLRRRERAVVQAHLEACMECRELFVHLESSRTTSASGTASIEATSFPDTPRYEVLRWLGAGGMGVVYEARDRERGGIVALKTLQRAHPASILRLKQEFRSLASIAHRNLVTLLELETWAGQWFFTMELIRGVQLLRHLRPAGRDATTPDPARLRAAFAQLAEGVQALHRAGKLHRDIKPSNVLVEAEGRVVLLDFGLVTELAARPPDLAGTVAYMSPEQAERRPLGPASDWYALGVVLLQAITGALPKDLGDLTSTARGAAGPRSGAAPQPALREHGELGRLCAELLRADPAQRPAGDEIIARLREHAPRLGPAPAEGFFGREGQLTLLREALGRSRRGRAELVLVRGPSGMGKSALCRRFLQEAARGGLVLAGRCYEREAIPYKALDSVIDALTQALRPLPRGELEALLPEDVQRLRQAFPVLGQLAPVAAAPQPSAGIDPVEQRRRLFSTLRELLARLARRTPLVLFIDDLQWGDLDSAALLTELLRPPAALPLLLLLCFRSEDEATSPLLDAVARLGAEHQALSVTVDPLDEREARSLARALLSRAGPRAEALVATLATEAGGSPFLLQELARHALAHPSLGAEAAAPALDVLLRDRAAALSPVAQRLLAAVALAGGPLPEGAALEAAEAAGALEPLAQLTGASLVLTRAARGEREVEVYHDRIREAVVGGLDGAARRALHGRIAQVLSRRRDAEPEALVGHYLAAGDEAEAGRYALLGAERATAALAFHRAAGLYGLSLRAAPGPRPFEVRERLARVLGYAGRHGEAAAEYARAADERAAAGGAAAAVLDLRRCAAEHTMRAGRMREGIAQLRAVLSALGEPLPRDGVRAIGALLRLRLRLRLQGLDARPAPVLPEDVRVRLEALRAASLCTASFADLVVAAFTFSRYLQRALEAGAPEYVARALCYEAAAVALSPGRRSRTRAEEILQRAERWTAIAGDSPELAAHIHLSRSVIACLLGHFARGSRGCEETSRLWRQHCIGMTWELTVSHNYGLTALAMLGELGRLRSWLAPLLHEADSQGDWFSSSLLRLGMVNMCWLAEDRPAEARRHIDEALALWGGSPTFHIQYVYDLIARAQLALYEARPEEAHALVEERWPTLRRLFVLRMPLSSIVLTHLRGRAALGVAARQRGAERRELLRAARACARTVRGIADGRAAGLATLLLAGAAALEGRAEEAAALLQAAAVELEGEDLRLDAACARLARARLLGPGAEAGPETEAEAAWLRGQGVADLNKMVALRVPGCGARAGDL